MIGGAQAVLAQQPARADQRTLPQRLIDEYRVIGSLAGDLEVELQVILQVLADARQIVHDLDAERRAAPPPARRRRASAAAAS